ncbi:hypothetical protein NLU66_16675 [Brachybacterium sp. NBEC-018]|uniref:hypothetical protein n=1 Tax=Brachybacterium sp. NBEC-018 TaxID=2996004 RepID=UPI002175056B|nr:hypothetical protein [Brachybacterium sp. NBEC-018]UVY83823.1 hypothetical protein NLU66_16675 [Brachybacterium sp. NBEC-018]
MTPAQLAQRHAVHDARRMATDERISELEWLVDGGVLLEFALPRVGWTPAAAEQALRRRGGHRFLTELRNLVSIKKRRAA